MSGKMTYRQTVSVQGFSVAPTRTLHTFSRTRMCAHARKCVKTITVCTKFTQPYTHFRTLLLTNFRTCTRTKMCTHTNSLCMGNEPKKTHGLWGHITILLKCQKTILLNLKTTGHMDIQIWNYLYFFFTFSKISVMSKLTVTLGFIF